MGLITDLAGMGTFGSGAKRWAKGRSGQSGQSSTDYVSAVTGSPKRSQQGDDWQGVTGAGNIPGSGMDEDDLKTGSRSRKRSSGNGRY